MASGMSSLIITSHGHLEEIRPQPGGDHIMSTSGAAFMGNQWFFGAFHWAWVRSVTDDSGAL